jgi:glycosyltransferase involved in cell wall biosynthesis
MVTSEWPTPQRPYHAPYLVQQVEFLRRLGVDVEVFPFRGARRPLNYLKAWVRLRRHLRQHQYDLLHAQFGQSALLAWPRRLPLVVTFHGCDLQGVKRPDGTMSWSGRFLQMLCQRVARHADAVILVSERMRRFIPRSVQASVIPTGLNFDEIPLVPRAEARRRLGLAAAERLVLFVGNPAETVKRHALARQAVDVLNRSYPARLVVGWGVLRPEILLLMNACDVLLMTSIQEGSPCVVKEALACDLPIVSLDVGDVPVRVSHVAGCEICEDERPVTIAAALERVLRRSERVRGREAVQELDERLLAARITDIYQTVLSKAPGRRTEPATAPLPAGTR